MPEELINLYAPGSIPGIPGEHAPGSYIVDWDARTLTASYATQPLEPAPGGDPEIIPDNNPPA